MKYIQLILVFVTLVSTLSCTTKPPKQITNSKDYEGYLNTSQNNALTQAKEELQFWQNKLKQSPNQYPYLAKIAAVQTQIFQLSGAIDLLKAAELNLEKVNIKTQYNHAGYLRALARNYISQHRFQEALLLLTKAEYNGEKLQDTHLMLVDVHLELGNLKKATQYLSKVKNTKNFDYLIRLSKYNDQIGNLDQAIEYLEQSLAIAKLTNNTRLLEWNYTNLGDYYGHASQIDASYKAYLKALALNPNNSYAKKGIAWIVFSYERNPIEAKKILQTIRTQNTSPDYFLLSSEIAEFTGNKAEKEREMSNYYTALENENYGVMYAKYTVLLYADDVKERARAIEIAKQEVVERPTPQSYDLLAWAYFKNGHLKKAQQIVEDYVWNKTSEPEALYHMAHIFKANDKVVHIPKIKQELIGAIYELGPNFETEILNL